MVRYADAPCGFCWQDDVGFQPRGTPYIVTIPGSINATAGLQFAGFLDGVTDPMNRQLKYTLQGSGTLTLGGTITTGSVLAKIAPANLAGNGFTLESALGAENCLLLDSTNSSMTGTVTLNGGTLDLGTKDSTKTIGTASLVLNGANAGSGGILQTSGAGTSTVSSSIRFATGNNFIRSKNPNALLSAANAVTYTGSLSAPSDTTVRLLAEKYNTITLSGDNRGVLGRMEVLGGNDVGTLRVTNANALGSLDASQEIKLGSTTTFELAPSSGDMTIARKVRFPLTNTIVNSAGNNVITQQLYSEDSAYTDLTLKVSPATSLTLNNGWLSTASSVALTISTARTSSNGTDGSLKLFGESRGGNLIKLNGLMDVTAPAPRLDPAETTRSFGDGSPTIELQRATHMDSQIYFRQNPSYPNETVDYKFYNHTFKMVGRGNSTTERTTRMTAANNTTLVIGSRDTQTSNSQTTGGIILSESPRDWGKCAVIQGGVYSRISLQGNVRPSDSMTANQGLLFAGARRNKAPLSAQRTVVFFWEGGNDSKNPTTGWRTRFAATDNTELRKNRPFAVAVPGFLPTQAQLQAWDAEALDSVEVEIVSDAEYGYDDPDSPVDSTPDDGSAGIYAYNNGTLIGKLVSQSADADLRVHTGSYFAVSGPLEGAGKFTKLDTGELRARSIDVNMLNIAGGTVSVRNTPSGETAVPSRVASLSIAGGSTPTARLDLTNNDLVVDYTGTSPKATIRSQLTTGRNTANNVSWDGNGIAASLANDFTDSHPRALGYMESSQLASAIVSEYGLDSTALLIKFTFNGDADLNGQVNFDDLLKVSQNYGTQTGMEWRDGDFDYDGDVDFDDLFAESQNYDYTGGVRRGGFEGAYAVFLELQAGAPWILEDALSHSEGYALFSPYLNGNGQAGRYQTQLQNYNLPNNLVPEPAFAGVIGSLLFIRRQRGGR